MYNGYTFELGVSMDIKEVPVTKIRPYENNPRNNADAVEYVANSIREFGFKQPIVVDKDGVIVVGHTRYAAAKQIGMKSVPVLYADDLTPQQIDAYRLADNKTNELAGWDFSKLDIEMEKLLDFNMEDFGFNLSDEVNLDEFLDENDLDEDIEKDKVVLSIRFDNYKEYERVQEKIENIVDEADATMSVKMA